MPRNPEEKFYAGALDKLKAKSNKMQDGTKSLSRPQFEARHLVLYPEDKFLLNACMIIVTKAKTLVQEVWIEGLLASWQISYWWSAQTLGPWL